MISKRLMIWTGVAVLVVGWGIGAAIATRAQDNDTPISGDALSKASAAALSYVCGGRVTETEVGDEDGYYEVEVTLDDGREIDVHLDKDFNVVSVDTSGHGPR